MPRLVTLTLDEALAQARTDDERRQLVQYFGGGGEIMVYRPADDGAEGDGESGPIH